MVAMRVVPRGLLVMSIDTSSLFLLCELALTVFLIDRHLDQMKVIYEN